MSYRLLCLDAGFTLLSPRRTLADALSEVLIADGHTITPDEMRTAWEEADRWFWDQYHRPGNDTWSDDERIEDYWREYHSVMLGRLGMHARREVLDRILASQFAADSWEPFPDVEAMLAAVRELGDVRIGIVSDWGSNLRGILAELGLDGYLDFVLPSGAVGVAKPNPAFFRLALDEARVEPNEALMVGDSYRADVLGAWGAGMDAVWLDRRQGINITPADEPTPTDVHRIHSLDELPAIVRQGGPPAARRGRRGRTVVDELRPGVSGRESAVVVDKFGGSVLRRPEDIAAAVAVVERQRAAGLRAVVVVSAFEGVTDTILGAARVLLPDSGAWLRDPAQAADSALARETDRALATGEALSAALFALGLQARGIPARSFSGAEAGIRTAAAHLGAEVRRVLSRPLRSALAEGLVPVVAGFQGVGTHGELTTLGRGGTDLSAVALAVALRAARCELFKGVGGVLEADPHLVPGARFLPTVDARQLELLAEMGAEVVHPVALRRARRGRLHLVVRALDDDAPQTVVRPTSRDEDGVLMLAVDRKERMARISLVGPAEMTPEVLPLPAHGEGSFDDGGLRVVWAEVPLASAASAAQAVHASLMGRPTG